MKKTFYNICVSLPLYIYALFVSCDFYTTYTGGFMGGFASLGVEFRGFSFAIILSVLEIFLVLKLKKIFKISRSQKKLIIVNLFSYFITYYLLLTFMKYGKPDMLAFSLPFIVILYLWLLNKFVFREDIVGIELNRIAFTIVISIYTLWGIQYYMAIFETFSHHIIR